MKKHPIYVVNMNGKPLMPTYRYGKVRHMLKNGEAKIIKRDPFFTIQLLRKSTEFTQKLNAGMDVGETIGLSVNLETKQLLSAELKTRSKRITSNLENKRMYRRTRRGKLRYRKARWENRGGSKSTCKHCGGNSKSGKVFCGKCLSDVKNIHQKYSLDTKTYSEKRLAPSLKHLVNTHFKIKDEISSILPLNNKDWVIEKTKFDIQKIENIDISGVGYQQGEMFGFTNLREYVLDRDEHMCQNPDCKHKKNKTKSDLKRENPYIKKGVVLMIHHIIYRSKGGSDKPSNLITLCSDCHTPTNHQPGNLLWEWMEEGKKIISNYSAATKMNLVASAFNEQNDVSFTYGANTKRKRQLIGLNKTHSNDAFSIALDDKYFEIVLENNKPILKLKEGLIFNIIDEPIKLNQTNGRENGRRSLQTFKDAKYVDSRDGNIKTGNELSKKMNKRTPIKGGNDRQFRSIKILKGSFVTRIGKSQYPNNSIIKFNYNDKELILEGGGMSGNNIYVKEFEKKTLASRKFNAVLLCGRKGIIKENIKQ